MNNGYKRIENMDKIQYLHQTCDTPGEAVQQIQGRNCVEIGKYRVHPYDPEHTGAHDHHHRRHQTLS